MASTSEKRVRREASVGEIFACCRQECKMPGGNERKLNLSIEFFAESWFPPKEAPFPPKIVLPCIVRKITSKWEDVCSKQQVLQSAAGEFGAPQKHADHLSPVTFVRTPTF